MKESIVKKPSGRVKRASLIARGPLNVRGKDPAYEYRIVNDIDDRVDQFAETGYEVVRDKDVSIGGKAVDTPSTEGSVKRISVGGGTKAVLMRIPKALYDEDQAEKEAALKQQEAAFRREALDGNYGNIKLTRD